MKLRVYTAGLGIEVNSFSPLPTGMAAFESLWRFAAGQLPTDAPMLVNPLAWQILQHPDASNVDLCLGPASGAQPGGIVRGDVYVALRDEILNDLTASGPQDVILLNLHGAMIADGYEDCEGDLLARVRAIVGPATVVGALLDPHGHLSPSMLQMADLLVCYKEYPHDDVLDEAARLVRLAFAKARGQVNPVKAVFDCRQLGVYHTLRAPMRELIRDLRHELDEQRALDISIIHGFPWGDTSHTGTQVLVTTHADRVGAEALARRFGERLIGLRGTTSDRLLSVSEGVTVALAAGQGPAVIADSSDNPGGGAPGDSTFVLTELMRRGISDVAVGLVHDPGAVQLAMAAGEGRRMPLRIGGKVCALSGTPIDLEVIVRTMRVDVRQSFGGCEWPLGEAVRVQVPELRWELILTASRVQCFTTECFSAFGVDLQAQRIIVVKSSQHFFGSFSRVAGTIVRVAAPGVLTEAFEQLPYRHLRRPVWPLDAGSHIAGR